MYRTILGGTSNAKNSVPDWLLNKNLIWNVYCFFSSVQRALNIQNEQNKYESNWRLKSTLYFCKKGDFWNEKKNENKM